jgi:hypothetical protein
MTAVSNVCQASTSCLERMTALAVDIAEVLGGRNRVARAPPVPDNPGSSSQLNGSRLICVAVAGHRASGIAKGVAETGSHAYTIDLLSFRIRSLPNFFIAQILNHISRTAEEADTLPLLSLTLARLYTNWIDVGGEELTLANYESLGGMRDVVNHEIEQILMGDSHDRQTALGLLRSALFRG